MGDLCLWRWREGGGGGVAAEAGRDWSNLPDGVLDIISTKIKSIPGYVRFRAVCRPWRSAADPLPRHLCSPPPWLMIAHDRDGGVGVPCEFLSFLDGKPLEVSIPPDLLSAEDRRCAGHPRGGWMVVVSRKTPEIFLLNPLTGTRFDLPPMTSFPKVSGYLSRAVLVLNPVAPAADPLLDCVVLGFCKSGNRPAFCRLGDKKWTQFKTGLRGCILDAGRVGGKFFARNSVDVVTVWEDNPSEKDASFKLVRLPRKPSKCQRRSVVGLSGELFAVGLNERKEVVELLRMGDPSGGQPKWVETKSIGKNNTLFCDGESIMPISESDFYGLKGNSIYIVNKSPCKSRIYDIHVTDLGDGSTEYLSFFWKDSLRPWEAPVWFMPSLR